jgi:hypothetical protein
MLNTPHFKTLIIITTAEIVFVITVLSIILFS